MISFIGSEGFAKWLALLLTIFVLCWSCSQAQITSMNSDRHNIIGARAAALADSYVAEQSDVGAMYWNPATLTFSRRMSVVLNYAVERIYGSDNTMTENVVAPVPLERGWGLGLGLTFSHLGRLTTVGSPIAGMSFHQFGFEVGLAKKLARAFSIGILVDTRYGKGSSTALGTVSSSVGAFYSPSPGVSYGVAFQGLGWGIEYNVVGGETVPSRIVLERSFQMGLSLAIPTQLDRQVVVLTLSNQKIIGVNGLVYKGGIEIIPMSFLILRTGYWVGPETSAGKLGGGIRVGKFQLDYAESLNELEPRFHQISVSFMFGAGLSPSSH